MDNTDIILNNMFKPYLAKKVRKAMNNPQKTITKEVAHAYAFFLIILINKLKPNDVAPGGPLYDACGDALTYTMFRTFYKGITLEKYERRLEEDGGLAI